MSINREEADVGALVNEFMQIYIQRPILTNVGGMGLNHSFALWRVLRELQPTLVAESGVFKGHSTWLIREALPNCQIVSFDINFINREFVDPGATYVESDFRDFDWSASKSDGAWLAFFDDHQNHLDRLKSAHWFGFDFALLEDNYPPGQGDFYSLRHMAAGQGMPSIQLSKEYLGSGRERRARTRLETTLWGEYWAQTRLVRPNLNDYKSVLRKVRTIQELSPLWLEEVSMFGCPYSDFDPLPPEPILASRLDGEFDYSYNFITLVEFLR